MNKVQKENAYRTSDGMLFTGTGASRKATNRQNRINSIQNMEKILAKSNEIFDIGEYAVGGNKLTVNVSNVFNEECFSVERATQLLVNAYWEIPRIVEFFNFLDNEIGSKP